MTSPSPGMISPAHDQDHIALLQLAGGDDGLECRPRAAGGPGYPSGSFSELAACALPRPSATDSAKLANSTVTNRIARDDDIIDTQLLGIGIAEQTRYEGEQQGDEEADLHYEHDRVFHHVPGVQLDKRTDAPPASESPG